MSLIDQFNRKISLLQKNEKVYTTKRIHFFYEGAVTEKELIDLVEKKFSENTELFKYLEFKLIKDATTNLDNILTILRNGEYLSVEGRSEKIFPHDYILFLYDLDVLFDFHVGQNIDNKKRVSADRRKMKTFINTLSGEFPMFNFSLVFSFPSIEYAIAMGLSSNYHCITCADSATKKEIFNYFSAVNGNPVSGQRKSFKQMFYETGLFSLDSLFGNAQLDRVNKKLPSDSLRPYVDKSEVHLLLDINKPFTYFDNIISAAQNIIDTLLNKDTP